MECAINRKKYKINLKQNLMRKAKIKVTKSSSDSYPCPWNFWDGRQNPITGWIEYRRNDIRTTQRRLRDL